MAGPVHSPQEPKRGKVKDERAEAHGAAAEEEEEEAVVEQPAAERVLGNKVSVI